MILCSPSPGVYILGEIRKRNKTRNGTGTGEGAEANGQTRTTGIVTPQGSWAHLVTGEDHSALLPAGVFGDLASHEVLQMSVQLGHETRAGRDAVRVEAFGFWQLLAFIQGLTNQFLCIAC